MYTCVEDLKKDYYTGDLYPVIYSSKNLMVKTMGSELIIMYEHYIMISYNRDYDIKRMFIYDMNKMLEHGSTHNGLMFENNELSLISSYINYNNGKVSPDSEDRIKQAFDKINKVKAFM